MGSFTQSVLFDKQRWKPAEAKRWLVSKGYRHNKIDVTARYLRFRQVSPARLASRGYSRYRNYRLRGGIELVLAFKT